VFWSFCLQVLESKKLKNATVTIFSHPWQRHDLTLSSIAEPSESLHASPESISSFCFRSLRHNARGFIAATSRRLIFDAHQMQNYVVVIVDYSSWIVYQFVELRFFPNCTSSCKLKLRSLYSFPSILAVYWLIDEIETIFALLRKNRFDRYVI
jgi:hypothetical protein